MNAPADDGDSRPTGEPGPAPAATPPSAPHRRSWRALLATAAHWTRTARARHVLAVATIAAIAFVAVRCASVPAATPGESILVCGQALPAGTRVVTFAEPGGYDAHRRGKWFQDETDGKLRYTPLRGGLPEALQARAAADGLTLADLRQVVHQFVLHFDVAGTSRQCFKVLQDVRGLSVHFLLDVDGTVYQTLDLRDKAHHATIANDFSVGVEIAHPGCWAQPLNADMRRWYAQDAQGWRMLFPGLPETGIRTPDFVPRPDRPEMVHGPVHGKEYWQFDYTPQQYRALAALCAALNRALPRIRLEVPRDEHGAVVTTRLPTETLRAFDGILGHFHVQDNKTDPGPAMQWERLLRDARALRDG